MVLSVMQKSNFIIATLPIAICIILLGIDCRRSTKSFHRTNSHTAPASVSTSACLDVEGKVLGGIKPCSKVYLYKNSRLNYSVVLAEISDGQAIMQECVNVTKAFKFSCLYPGKYALVIPTTSYNGSVGAPLPHEFDFANVSIRIAFQGGDSKNKVGTFSLIQPPLENKISCEKCPFSCLKNRGNLYIGCPLERR